MKDGKAKRLIFNYPLLMQNCWEIDGEPIDFEWNILPGRTSLQILQGIQSDLQGRDIEAEEIGYCIIFMSMCNDIDWTVQGSEGNCISISDKVKTYAQRFSHQHWTFFALADGKKWYGNPQSRT